MYVRCVSGYEQPKWNGDPVIVAGNVYRVVKREDDLGCDTPMLTIIDDDGVERGWYEWRFRPVEAHYAIRYISGTLGLPRTWNDTLRVLRSLRLTDSATWSRIVGVERVWVDA